MLLLQLAGGRNAGQTSQEQEIGFAATAEGGRLGRLQRAAGQLEGLQGLPPLHQQQQPAHLAGGGNLQGRLQAGVRVGQARQLRFVGGAPIGVGEQVGAGPQQLRPRLQGFVCKSPVGQTVQAGLQGAQDPLGIGGRRHAQQAEVVDRQVQSDDEAWPRL